MIFIQYMECVFSCLIVGRLQNVQYCFFVCANMWCDRLNTEHVCVALLRSPALQSYPCLMWICQCDACRWWMKHAGGFSSVVYVHSPPRVVYVMSLSEHIEGYFFFWLVWWICFGEHTQLLMLPCHVGDFLKKKLQRQKPRLSVDESWF